MQSEPKADEDAENNIKFDPPVYRQRYGKVFDILNDEIFREEIKKVVDFGCAEFGLFLFMRRMYLAVNEFVFVDIEEEVLIKNVSLVEPSHDDYRKMRIEPLNIKVCVGSVGDPDFRLVGTDVVSAIELIEHLYPDVLEKFVYNIFGFIRPKLVIITTPNADFNVLLPNFKGFRHDDHKFEWSRQQFEEWSNNITSRYPNYAVRFSGLGEIPGMTDSVGCCSQVAVYTRKDVRNSEYVFQNYFEACKCDSDRACSEKSGNLCTCNCCGCSPKESAGVCTFYSKSIATARCKDEDNKLNRSNYYKTIADIDYPVDSTGRTKDEKMLQEFLYVIDAVGQVNGRFYKTEYKHSEIPLETIIYGQSYYRISLNELNKLLLKFGYKREECFDGESGENELCVVYDPKVIEFSDSSTEESDYWD